MQLEEARAMKQALLGGAVALSSPDGARAFGVAEVGAFVGIVPSDRADGYRVAVRLTQPVADVEEYRSSLVGVVGPDVDVRYVGPIRALGEPGAADGPAAPYTVTEVDAPTGTDTCADSDTPTDQPGVDEPEPPAVGALPTPEELQQRVRPLVRGASVAHEDVTAGTIGAFVTVADSTATHILSNNHVLGDSDRGEPGDAVLQPGPADGGTAADRVGELLRAVTLDPDTPNLVDAALAVLDAETAVDAAAHDGALTGVVDPAEVTGEVVKIGRTTGYTRGRITAVEVDGVPVGYDTGVYTFDDQVEIEGVDGGFSAGGDSGSVIYTPDERLGVGLLFAGSTTGGTGGDGVTYANSLATVLSTLGATLVQ